jgi:hypothetical protein
MRQQFASCFLPAVLLVGAVTVQNLAVAPPALAQTPTVPTVPLDWERVTPANQGFTVTMPGKPQTRRFNLPVQDNTYQLPTSIYMTQSSTSMYAVMVMDMPFRLDDPAVVSKALDQGMNSAIARIAETMPVKLSDRQAITVKGYLGNQVTMTAANPAFTGKIRYLVVQNRLYGLIATTPSQDLADLDRFIASFSITAPEQQNTAWSREAAPVVTQ